MTNNSRIKEAKKVTWVGFIANLFLCIFKLAGGILGKSTAMVADAVHSVSDFATDVIVIVMMNISGKERDEDHQYGHGKFETFATLLISIALVIVGVGIFWNGLLKVISATQGEIIEQPTYLALIAALVSIVVKEALYWYTKKAGERIDSQAVIANAWHHRSDSFSSIGTALGISGAMFLNEKWRILDPLAGIIVSVFIVKVSIQLAVPAINELLEKSLPEDIEKRIGEIILSNEEVKDYHNLKTRKIGSTYAIDVHIKLDRNIDFVHSHDTATDVERKLRSAFGEKTIINIHTEPYYSEH
ncbi:cation diffusion facilitator family transporter [Paludibacteraceae bacterium OttesenSCG-928-F17]|nr:cation diffusion facilitator family transporter [Paludibacteraceae bacterium OttesenSCG-928-F17]